MQVQFEFRIRQSKIICTRLHCESRKSTIANTRCRFNTEKCDYEYRMQSNKVRLRVQDQREFSVICRPLWRKMAPQERGRVDPYGVVACYGMVFCHCQGFLLLLWFSIIGMVFTISMTVFFWYCFVPFHCFVCNGFFLLVWYCAVAMILCPSFHPS